MSVTWRVIPLRVQEIFGKGDSDKDGFLSSEEYVRLHREAEDEQGPYDQVLACTCLLQIVVFFSPVSRLQ